MSESILQNAELLLFVGILANQGGVPVPVSPWLLAAGVLAASGHLSLTVVVVGAVGAALAADRVVWPRTLARGGGAGRTSSHPAPAAGDGRSGGARLPRPPAGLRVERPLPARAESRRGGLSGVARVSLARFLLYSSGSALAWAGAWVGVGFLLAGSIPESPDWLGIPATVWVAIAVTAVTMGVVPITGWRRRHQRVDETEAAAARLMGPAA